MHGDNDRSGFVPRLIQIARKTGVSAYMGAGQNRWPAVHRLDAARLFRLALERGTGGSRYHGVTESGIPFIEIAAAIGQALGVPVVEKTAAGAAKHFSWLSTFVSVDNPASSAITQARLNWTPKEATLLADLREGKYFTTRR